MGRIPQAEVIRHREEFKKATELALQIKELNEVHGKYASYQDAVLILDALSKTIKTLTALKKKTDNKIKNLEQQLRELKEINASKETGDGLLEDE